MSVKIMAQVWDEAPSAGGELLVLLAIADFSNEKHGCAWPSIDTLAKKSRLGERQVQRAIRSLMRKGWLRVGYNDGPKGCNTYTVTVPDRGGDKIAPVTYMTTGGDAHVTQTVIEPLCLNNTRFQKPTAEQMIAYGDTMEPKLPPDECRRCWAYYESNGWKVGRNPMRNWQAAMINWRKGYAQPTLALNDKPAKSIYELTKIMEAKQRVADSIRMKHSIEVAGGRQWNSAEQKQKYIDMCKDIKAINEQISKR